VTIGTCHSHPWARNIRRSPRAQLQRRPLDADAHDMPVVRANARFAFACALALGALWPVGADAEGAATSRTDVARPARVWVLARAGRARCSATLRVRADGRSVSVRVRGTIPLRYVTALHAGAGDPISTAQSPRERCRAIVKASGTLGERPLYQTPRHDTARVRSPGVQPAPSAAQPPAPAPGASPAASLPASGESQPEQAATPPARALPPTGEKALLGTFDVVGAGQMNAWAAAGGTAVVVPVIWANAQPSAGGAVTLQSAGNDGQDVLSEIAEARAAHLEVFLELDLQYPPDWVKQSVPQYVDQGGNAFSGSVPGQDVRDWVWSQTGREAVAGFAAGAIGALAPALGEIAGIRVGGGMYGEMQYPDDGSTVNGQPSYWGYDSAAQGGVDLASGELRSPLPGYVYGQGSTAQDAEWASWYLHSLGNFVHWYIVQLRADGWQGPVYVLHPSYGVRENWSLRSQEYQLQLALGTDYAVQMDSYDTLPNAWPWSTWADDAEPYYFPGDTVDSDMAAWRKLLLLAQQRGLASHIIGESTGGGGVSAIDRLTGGAMRAGYSGIFYLDYPALTADDGSLLGTLTSAYDEQLSTDGE
jgi:hypothetical protein